MNLKSIWNRLIEVAAPSGTSQKPDLHGDFSNWDEATAATTGYDSDLILEKTRAALLQVKNGQAAFERDSVLFFEIEYNWPALSGLLFSAARHDGALNVVDFGGSLGSTYYQSRAFLSQLKSVRWNVVEQKKHVEVGQEWFANSELQFFENIDDCIREAGPCVALLSSVLQYIEHPFEVLDKFFDTSIDTIVIDRTPFWNEGRDILCVQIVPPEIYSGSYPSWVFSRENFRSRIPRSWEILTTFACADSLLGPPSLKYEGMIIVKKVGIREPGLRSTISPRLDQS